MTYLSESACCMSRDVDSIKMAAAITIRDHCSPVTIPAPGQCSAEIPLSTVVSIELFCEISALKPSSLVREAMLRVTSDLGRPGCQCQWSVTLITFCGWRQSPVTVSPAQYIVLARVNSKQGINTEHTPLSSSLSPQAPEPTSTDYSQGKN